MAEGPRDVDSQAPASASTLILLQVSARALTFVLNQLLIRLVSPSIFGLANIQLELLLSTILFLSRDGFRTILIRNEPASSSASSKHVAKSTGPRSATTNSMHNISLLPIPIGFAFTAAACTAYTLHISPAAMHAVPTFRTSIALYAVGALSELLYEPLLIRAVRLGHPALRVKAEGAAVFVKVISTIATILLLPQWSTAPLLLRRVLVDEKAIALLAFGIGQASFGLTMLAVHLAFFISQYGLHDTLDLYLPRPEELSDGKAKSGAAASKTVWFDRPTLNLCAEMCKQGSLKHALTEADKIAVAKFASLEDQGGYALASNYGSLVARILFQPVEETSRIVFSSELVALDPAAAEFASSPSKAPKSTVDRVSNMLSGLFRLHLLLACLMTTFGGPLSTAFLYIMAGPQWALATSAPAILAAYTFYLPVMGINGFVEGFLQSVASRRQVEQYSKVLLTASAGFVGALAGTHMLVGRSETAKAVLGETGLVWANVLSLAVRAGWCWAFVIEYFRLAKGTTQGAELGPQSVLPSRPTLAVFVLLAAVLRVVSPKLMPTNAELLLSSKASKGRLAAIRLLMPTLALAGACLGVALGSVIVFERRALAKAVGGLRRKTPVEEQADTRKTQ
ncbi:RFT1 [Kalmanozyma brasiliensis GHG001]|uniref:Man(5)GlcNAc(2)-PP-dolichol translocation protein RFT1 n=1 Tax=Kalmanozyma brasiliensis (strain GHG001) TaxID=1365824 RepID=V5E6N6_KALBG|nr:RFT1 [Kalmanozyma brasiliensis GHG001]EST05931.1 RFT1 [Kalmanozyma brasiliensis GHG001]